MSRLWIFWAALWSAGALQAQDPNLANQYFSNGEYEKAAVLYEELFNKDNRNDYYFGQYIACLQNLERYEEGEKALRKEIKKNAGNVQLYVTYGVLLDRQGKFDAAKVQYQTAIDKMTPDFSAVTRLAAAFTKEGKFDFAIATYERGAKALNDPHRFAFNLGELYRRQGNNAKMVENYLHALEGDPGKLPTVETYLARFLGAEDIPELQAQLYDRIQKNGNPDMIELLAWSFIQQLDFKNALRQYKALDKQLGENGQRIFKLAGDAAANKDYDTAISAYEFIINEKGSSNLFFFESKRAVMNCRRSKITEGFSYTDADLRTLESDYEQFLGQYGSGKQTAAIVLELADLEARYLNNLPKATTLLDELRQAPGIDRDNLARVKINLADYYLMQGEIWESTLLYSQVDKDFKEEPLGQEARFKNAKLSYFNGDFQWAQAQFDVLKASTSKLISNDALDLSVFIMDNLNLDTTADAITLYASAEMLVFQNRFAEALVQLDSLRSGFPEHALQDDILFLEAQIHEKKREWEPAAVIYRQIVEKYPKDIRADNSLFALAQLEERQLNNPEKAKELYEKIFIDYSGSVFALEARKRYRILRGDSVQ
jgi:TolA-binding protein